MAMAYEIIKVNEKYDGRVDEIVLGPPPANIVSAALMKELAAQVEASNSDPHKKLIVITGEGKHFSFGASVEEHTPDQVANMLPVFHGMIWRVLSSGVPTVACVKGLSLGGGFELALACAMIFCDRSAAFGVPEIQLGVFPPPASVLLPFKCGESASRRIILTGEKVPAEDAIRLGFVDTVVEKGQLDEALSAFVEEHILPKSASSLRIANEAAMTAIASYYDANIEKVEKLYLEKLMSTQDAVEGIQAFLDKRPPTWKDN
jgi:cyclohexa-1,5-dienecarbonyl-CoA hydratase